MHSGSVSRGATWWGLHWTASIPTRSSMPELRTLGRQGSQNTALVTKNQHKGKFNLSLATLQYALWFSKQGFLLMGTPLDSFHTTKVIHARTSDPKETRKSKYSTRHTEPSPWWVEYVTGNLWIRTVGQHSSVPPDGDSTWHLPHCKGHSRQNLGP